MAETLDRPMRHIPEAVPLSGLAGVVRKFARHVAEGTDPSRAARWVGVSSEDAYDTAAAWLQHPKVTAYLKAHANMVLLTRVVPLALKTIEASQASGVPWGPRMKGAELALKTALDPSQPSLGADLEHASAADIEARLVMLNQELEARAREAKLVVSMPDDNPDDLFD